MLNHPPQPAPAGRFFSFKVRNWQGLLQILMSQACIVNSRRYNACNFPDACARVFFLQQFIFCNKQPPHPAPAGRFFIFKVRNWQGLLHILMSQTCIVNSRRYNACNFPDACARVFFLQQFIFCNKQPPHPAPAGRFFIFKVRSWQRLYTFS